MTSPADRALACYRFGRFSVSPADRCLLIDDIKMPLGGRAFDVLMTLLGNAGRTVSKTELLDAVWPNLHVEEINLQVQVSALRKLLGPGIITTIPGRGYRFSALLENAAGPAQPSPVTARMPGQNLPVKSSQLVGRNNDIRTLTLLLQQHRLVTIVGPGGIGKTHLAQSVAQEMRRAPTDGIVWIELAPLSNSALVPNMIALALGVTPASNCPSLESIIAAFATTSLLIVLDNAEHVRDAVAQVTAALSNSTSGLRFLVTSQVRLNLPGEQVYRLGALALPDGEVSAQKALEYGAVALFVARAQAQDRHFALTEANVGIVVDICRRLDGIALALELAAARLLSLGLEAIVLRLGERFRLLDDGISARPTRQQTLRAAFDWSYGLLSTREQSVFRKLSVFIGGFTLSELIPVVAHDEGLDEWIVIDLLSNLVERSLVAVDHNDPPRYNLFESVHAFALEQLETAGERAALRVRHLHYYRDRVEAARNGYHTRYWPQHRDWLKENYANVRAALEWSLAAKADIVNGAVVAIGMHDYWMEYAQADEAGAWLSMAHLHVDKLDPLLQARLLLAIGSKFVTEGQYDQAEAFLKDCLVLSDTIDSALPEWAAACNNLAEIKQREKSAYNEARPLFKQALGVYRALGNRKAQAVVLHNMAHGYLNLGQVRHAEVMLVQALRMSREERDEMGAAIRLILLAECAFEYRQPELAIERGQEALAIQRQFGNNLTRANWLQRCSKYELARGHPDAAGAALSEALGMWSSAAPQLFFIELFDNLAGLALAVNQFDCAARLLGIAEDNCEAGNVQRSAIRQRQTDTIINGVRAALTEQAYRMALNAGRGQTLTQGLELGRDIVKLA